MHHFVNVQSQWDTTLHIVVSHWLGAFVKWSLKGHSKNLHVGVINKELVVQIQCFSKSYLHMHIRNVEFWKKIKTALKCQWFCCALFLLRYITRPRWIHVIHLPVSYRGGGYAISSIPLFSHFLSIVKTQVIHRISCLYLTSIYLLVLLPKVVSNRMWLLIVS